MHLDPAVVPIDTSMRNEPGSLDRHVLSPRDTLSRRDRTCNGRTMFAPLYDLISSSTLTFDRRDRVCSFTGPGEERFAPWSFDTPSRASERALLISVDRFFLVDSRPRIKSRESRRGGRRAAATDPEAAATGRTVEQAAVYDTPAYATNRSTSCFTTAREIGPRGVCDAIAPATRGRS